jgi:hypothetical protein
VEGRVFKAPNTRVTVYGRLVGSAISVSDPGVLERLASGTLEGPLAARMRPGKGRYRTCVHRAGVSLHFGQPSSP